MPPSRKPPASAAKPKLSSAQRKTRTKTQRIAHEALIRNLIHLEGEGWLKATLRKEVPEAWHTLEADLDVEEPKEKITIYVDRSVARFYRAMGKGYQARINRVLATWAQLKISGELRVDDFLKDRIDPATDQDPDE